MNFDLRLPLGIIFSLFGGIFVVYGLVSDKSIYARSLGFNVNLIWGAVLLAFGLVMLCLAMKARNRH
jgi:hypothetical protein